MPRYAVTIFLSAFLLFQVEPIIARFIVPWFGGSAAVWTTCLLFFQIALLGGYLYSHGVVAKLSTRKQAFVHLSLLFASALIVLLSHITPATFLKPVGGGDPSGRILLVLFATVGVPYFTLSTTGPLLQAWYAREQEAKALETGTAPSPYRLYSLSNIGSMLALLSYPIVVEPLLTVTQQAWVWSGAYLLFVCFCAVLAWRVVGLPTAPPETSEGTEAAPVTEQPPTILDYAAWIGLSACTSVLLIAVTNHISQNVAAVPLLWIIPLSLYLLTFIWCFGPKTWKWHPAFLPFPAIAFALMAYALNENQENMDVNQLVPLWMACFFVCCLLCHGELARQKPAPRFLTGFYLMISIGGALGGVFVALIAPRIFSAFFELPLSIGACAVIALFSVYRIGIRQWEGKAFWAIVAAASAYLCWILGSQAQNEVQGANVSLRSFYGVLQTHDYGKSTTDPDRMRTLANGTILHGSQYLDPAKQDTPTTYYGKDSGVGIALRLAQEKSDAIHAGFIGLGTGTLAAYGRKGDDLTFYEINAQDEWVARHEFAYLSNCPADVHVVLGDARLSLEAAPTTQAYDVLAVDAFSSDSIPIHLLTHEAFGVYFKHLKPGGILAVHVSNRYVDLKPVVASGAQTYGKNAVVVKHLADDETAERSSEWLLVSDRKDLSTIPLLQEQNAYVPIIPPTFRPWTDGYSNLFQLVKKGDD